MDLDPATVAKLKVLTAWFSREVLDQVKKYLKRRHRGKPVFFPEDQEQFKKVIDALEIIKTMEGFEPIKEFFEKFSIVSFEGEYGVVYSKRVTIGDIRKKFIESKTKEIEQNIGLIPLKVAPAYLDLKTEKETSFEVAEIANKLDPYFRSLIALSITVEKLYNEGNIEKAEKIKYDIRKRYDTFGLKFCNLFGIGYLKTFINQIYSDSSKYPDSQSIANKLKDFVEKDAKDVFFIHQYMEVVDVENVLNNLKVAISKKEEYAAVHSLGKAIRIARHIVDIIKEPEGSDYTIIEKARENEFSKMWYRENGICMYELVEGWLK